MKEKNKNLKKSYGEKKMINKIKKREKMENENEIIRQGLTYVSEIKKQQQDLKKNENNKENFNLNKIDETDNNTSTEETNSTSSRFSV